MIESTLEPPSGPALNAHRTGVDSRQRIGQPAGVSLAGPSRETRHDGDPRWRRPRTGGSASGERGDAGHGTWSGCPVLPSRGGVPRYRRPRSHEHSGRQAKVAASSLHTFTPGGSPLFRLRASGTTRGITPPGPGDGVTIFGNGSNHGPTQPVLTAAAPAPHQGPMRSTCAGSTPPPSGTPGACPPAPPGARPRHGGGGNDVTAVCQVPSTEIPPKGPQGTWGPPDRKRLFTPIARSNISRP